MKKLLTILLLGIVLSSTGQDFVIEHEAITKETLNILVFKHRFQAIWMERRFERSGMQKELTGRNDYLKYYEITQKCLKFKCEYHILYKAGDERKKIPGRKKLIIPRWINLN